MFDWSLAKAGSNEVIPAASLYLKTVSLLSFFLLSPHERRKRKEREIKERKIKIFLFIGFEDKITIMFQK
jgi:hypothetical protein